MYIYEIPDFLTAREPSTANLLPKVGGIPACKEQTDMCRYFKLPTNSNCYAFAPKMFGKLPDHFQKV